MEVYLDNSATTEVSPEAAKKAREAMELVWGNPSSLHSRGLDAERLVLEARENILRSLGITDRSAAKFGRLVFTGSGTEADNWVKEIMRSLKARGKNHFITSAVEHHALLHSAQRLQKEGFEVTFIPVDREGRIDPEQVRAAIRPETGLVSIMFANNEIGTIYPIQEIGAICRQAGVLFHTDAVQAAGHLPINVKEMNIDLLSLSAHKFHGPKGVGAFYCRRGIPLPSLIDGGAQERGKRAGTENVAGIVGLGAALRLANEEMSEASARVSAMRDRLIDGILQTVPMCRLNGPRHNRLPGNCNISFLGIEGESLLLRLDLAGIAASSGSACTSGSLDPSHVLLAIGLPHEVAHGSVRLSLSDYNTEEDVDYILEKLPEIVSTLRSMSPLWEQIQKGQIHYDI